MQPPYDAPDHAARPGPPGRTVPGDPRARRPAVLARWSGLVGAASLSPPAHASLFQGETLDTVADVISWVALIVVPVAGITVFWMVHILPEKIAEKNHHPQAKAIKTLCLLSLFFGGLLWPLAWLWVYTRPVFHKLAYGAERPSAAAAGDDPPPGRDEREADPAEVKRLRNQVARLEAQLAARDREERA